MSAPSADDEAFLDDAFEEAVRRVTAGEPVESSQLSIGRPELGGRVEELVRLARRVAVRKPATAPAVSGYEIVREVGSGASGTVFLARQKAVGNRLVALKVLTGARVLSRSGRERFLGEAGALSRFSHPNVVTVHDVVDDFGICAYSMEWVDGSSLAQVIRSEERRVGTEWRSMLGRS